MGSAFGQAFQITTFGESHGGAVGVVVDGCPPRLPLAVEEIQHDLDRRRPGQSRLTTQRQEAAEQMMELIRVFPQSAPVIGDLLVKNLDWPGADQIAERLKAMLPANLQGEGEDPRLAQAMQMVQKLLHRI